jgi:ribosomal protein L17
MANQIDTNKLKQAEAASSIVKDMITSAIEQSAANTTLASEALKQASNEVAQIQTLISQVQSRISIRKEEYKYYRYYGGLSKANN